jgi:hypothetical protein
LAVKPEINENIVKYPPKIRGVNNYVDNFDNYPRINCGNINKKYIFDDLLNYN